MKDIIRWDENGWLNKDKRTGINSLARWFFDKDFLDLTEEESLAYSTIEIEFDEVWRDMHPEKVEEKKKKGARKRKKIAHKN